MGFLGESAPPASCLRVPIEAGTRSPPEFLWSRWPNPKREFLSFIVGVRYVSAPWRVLFDWGFGACHNTLTHPVGKCAGREIAWGDFLFHFQELPPYAFGPLGRICCRARSSASSVWPRCSTAPRISQIQTKIERGNTITKMTQALRG
jgi:hypothetical protein